MKKSLVLTLHAGPRSLVDKRVDPYSIRFLTAVVRASFGSHVGKPSSAYLGKGVSRFTDRLDMTITVLTGL